MYVYFNCFIQIHIFFMLKYLLRHDIIIIRQVLGESEVGQLTSNARQQIGTSQYLPGSLDSITKQSQ